MRLLGKALATLFSLGLLGGLGVGGYIAIKDMAALFVSMDFPVAKDTAIGWGVLLAAALAIARSIRQSSRQGRLNQLHSERAATYRLFIELRADLIQQGRSSVNGCTPEISEAWQTLDRRLALYGSPAVIKAHTALRAMEREHGTQDRSLQLQLGKALMEMRKDLGSKTVGLRAEELLQLLIPDSDTISSTSEARDFNRRAVLAPRDVRS